MGLRGSAREGGAEDDTEGRSAEERGGSEAGIEGRIGSDVEAEGGTTEESTGAR